MVKKIEIDKSIRAVRSCFTDIDIGPGVHSQFAKARCLNVYEIFQKNNFVP